MLDRVRIYISRKRDIGIAVFHAFVIVGLLIGLGGAQLADQYFNRGVVAGTSALDPIPFTDVNPVGVNTFLDQEPDPEVVERSMDMISDAGIGYIRQIFGWFDIEPSEKGSYVDRFGNPSWDKFDRIVDLAEERDIEIIVRLEKPPRWAREGQENVDRFPDGPPNEIEDWVDYVEAVATRYEGRVHYYQLWNEPNLEGEWGGLPIDPAGYLELLRAGYTAIKAVDPDAVVLLAGLAPTDQRGPVNVSELIYLQDLYDLGAADYFDIVSAMVYGYGYSPYDRRVEFARNNFSRVIQMREIMEDNGDDGTPIWAVEYGWVSLPEDWQGEPSPWGEPVSRDVQAEYLIEGYERAQREWPWMGVMAVWAFRFVRPPDHEDEVANPTRGFALVEHDFTPYPAYEAIKEAAPDLRIRGTGEYRADDLEERLAAGRSISIPFDGQRLDLRFEAGAGGEVAYTIDDSLEQTVRIEPGGHDTVTLARELPDGNHLAVFRLLVEPTDDPPRLILFRISREPVHALDLSLD
ncbi:MAG: cellulase family glycosylhydrolase [Thermomicrobiales bacterium]